MRPTQGCRAASCAAAFSFWLVSRFPGEVIASSAPTMVELIIRELESDAEIAGAFSLLNVLRERLRPETFLEQVRIQEAESYRLVGGYVEGKLVTLAGVRRQHTLSRGPHAFV